MSVDLSKAQPADKLLMRSGGNLFFGKTIKRLYNNDGRYFVDKESPSDIVENLSETERNKKSIDPWDGVIRRVETKRRQIWTGKVKGIVNLSYECDGSGMLTLYLDEI